MFWQNSYICRIIYLYHVQKLSRIMPFREIIYFQLLICIQGFTQHCHSDRCFWVSDTNTAKWANARTACQSEGGDLAVMETEELYNYVINTFR